MSDPINRDLNGKIALVTGASKGIGRAMTLELVNAGLSVGLIARGATALHEVATEVRAQGGRCVAVAGDIAVLEDVERLTTAVLSEFGRIDALINNAGVGTRGTVEEIDPAEWQRVIATNLTGPFLMCRAVVPIMKKQQGGHIINISSGAGKQGYAGMAAYCASKFGLMGFAESLSKEVGDHRIKVTTICPGTTVTDFGGSRPARHNADGSPIKALAATDVADAVLYLLRQPPTAWTAEMNLWPFLPMGSSGNDRDEATP